MSAFNPNPSSNVEPKFDAISVFAPQSTEGVDSLPAFSAFDQLRELRSAIADELAKLTLKLEPVLSPYDVPQDPAPTPVVSPFEDELRHLADLRQDIASLRERIVL